ncbi:MAG: glycosyltransferase family 2 protein [Pseudomonadota bacterium]
MNTLDQSSETVYIVLVNFNNASDTLECISSIQNIAYRKAHILIVDNGSIDHSFQYFCESLNLTSLTEFEGLQVGTGLLQHNESNNWISATAIASEENLGFTGGNNLAIRFALLQRDCKFIWLLNNDTVVDKDSLTSLVSEHNATIGANDKPVLVGSVILDYRDRNTIQAVGGGRVGKLTGKISHPLRGQSIEAVKRFTDKEMPDYISGCSVLISSKNLRTLGPLNNSYFLYWEDTEWSFRCKKRGGDLVIATSSFVYHRKGSTSHRYPLVGFFDNRNCLLFTQEYHPKYLLPTFISRIAIIIAIGLKHRNWQLFKASIGGVWAFVLSILGRRIEDPRI